MSAAADILRDADILACFGQVVPVQPAVPVRRTRRPYKLSGLVSRFHLGTARRRGNTFREEIFSRTEKESRVESLPSPNSKRLDADISGRRPQLLAANISAAVLFNVLYYRMRTCLTGSRHFMLAHIFCGLRIFCIGAVASWNIS
jgi:hypothetical protein